MKDARSLLDGIFAGPEGAEAALGQARQVWDRQSPLAKGAIAGGLLGALLGGSGTRRLAGAALKMGGAALVGGLAWQAWNDWKQGRDPAPAAAAPVALPPPPPAFLPAETEAADDLAARLLRAMVAAVKADGHVTTRERGRIGARLAELGLGPQAQALIAAELDAPLDPGRIAALARGPEEAAELYAASLLMVDPDAPAEKGYLTLLAARLGLEPTLVAHLHARAAALG